MSVAFRRESDEEHLEPKFELPIPAGPNLVTRRGLRLIRDRVAELEAAIGQAQGPAAVTGLQRDLRYWRSSAPRSASRSTEGRRSCGSWAMTKRCRLRA